MSERAWLNKFLKVDPLPPEPESGPLQDCTIDLVKPEPGQTVVVAVPKRGRDFVEEVIDQLKRTFPDNRCVVMEEGVSLSVEDDQLRELLSACRQWRNGTLNRLKLVSPRNEPQPLKVDQALLDAIDKAEGKA